MDSAPAFGEHVRTFFHEYLAAQRNVSPNTVLSYRDALKLFFLFAAGRLHKTVVQLEIDDLTVDVVLAFLDHLEKERKSGVSTRNTRLAALHVFYRHVAARAPDRLELCQRIAGIPVKRTSRAEVRYLEPEEMDALLRAIDRSTFDGRRDYALVAVAYQTGARVQELVDLRASDLQLDAPPHVRVWGKGRKERLLPLWPKTATLLRRWLAERQVDLRGTAPVFINRVGQPLTRWGVRYILKKHAASASRTCKTISSKRIHPHVLRHTTAVHMLQSGAGLTAIRDVLGHAHSATTSRYARFNLEMKRKAIEACALVGPKIRPPPVPVWRSDTDLLAQLEALGRRGSHYGE